MSMTELNDLEQKQKEAAKLYGKARRASLASDGKENRKSFKPVEQNEEYNLQKGEDYHKTHADHRHKADV